MKLKKKHTKPGQTNFAWKESETKVHDDDDITFSEVCPYKIFDENIHVFCPEFAGYSDLGSLALFLYRDFK